MQINSGATLNLSFSNLATHDLINVIGNLNLASGTINLNVSNVTGSWTREITRSSTTVR